MGRTACTEPQCLYKGDLYLYLTVELYLCSPYGPYGLYKGDLYLYLTVELYLYSPLWAVRPVQILSACTRVTFTFTLPYTTCPERGYKKQITSFSKVAHAPKHCVQKVETAEGPEGVSLPLL